MGTSIQQQPENTALSAIFAAHSGMDGAQPPELSAEAKTENYAAATAAGLEDNGSVAGLAIVETKKQMRVEKEEKKKKFEDAIRMSAQQAFEHRRQEILDDLGDQIREKQKELGDFDNKITVTKDKLFDLGELQILLDSGDYDVSNPEHRSLAERNGENPDADIQEMKDSVDSNFEATVTALAELKAGREVVQAEIELLGDAQNLVFDAVDDASLDAVLEDLKISGIVISVNEDLSFDDRLIAVDAALYSAAKDTGDRLLDDLGGNIDISHLSVEEQVEFIMKKCSEYGARSLGDDTLTQYANQLSDDARDIVMSIGEVSDALIQASDRVTLNVQEPESSSQLEITYAEPSNG